jgi:hypothetical protein
LRVDGNPADTGLPGVRPSDLLALPEAERRLLQWLMRRGRTTACEAAGQFGLEPAAAISLLEALAQRGFVQGEGGEPDGAYQPRTGSARTAGTLPDALWRKLRDP